MFHANEGNSYQLCSISDSRPRRIVLDHQRPPTLDTATIETPTIHHSCSIHMMIMHGLASNRFAPKKLSKYLRWPTLVVKVAIPV